MIRGQALVTGSPSAERPQSDRSRGPAAPTAWRGLRLPAGPPPPALAPAAAGIPAPGLLPALAVALLAALALAGCGGPRVPLCEYPEGTLYSAELDSLGRDGFAARPAAERSRRRRLAALWLRRGTATRKVAERLRSLRTAVGLDPNAAAAWLELGRTLRWAGAPDPAQAALQQAWETAADLEGTPAERSALRLRIAAAMAWLHYDTGLWQRGLDWTERAGRIQTADREVLLIEGLLEAGSLERRRATAIARDIERLDFFRSDWRWVRGMADFYLGYLKEAEFQMADTRPDPLHRAECYRDLGLLYEQIGEWRKAERAYGHQFDSLELAGNSCLVRQARRHPDAPPGARELPAWLAFDRFLAAGSLSTYAQVALERFEAATGPDERRFWAEATVAAATYGIRKTLRPPWGHAWRGRVYAQIDLPRLAIGDLRHAVRVFRGQGRRDAPTLYWLGHLLLLDKEYARALPHLREAVAAAPGLATAWSDLGYGLVMTGSLERARQALDRALELDPDLAVAWYNSGLMHFNARQWDAAVQDLERAARLAPDSPEITDMLQRASLMLRQQRRQTSGEEGEEP